MAKLNLLKRFFLSFMLGLLSACSQQTSNDKQPATQSSEASMSTANSQLSPPMARKVDHLLQIHQQTRNDPYYWLRDDKRENVKTR